jgi:hypothetical protein
VPNSRSSSAQKAWIVPRLTRSARDVNCRSRRDAISPAALLVKVNTQMRSGSSARFSTRNRIRSIRQKVLPAPGPARTRTGSDNASMASRCESVATWGGSDEIVAAMATIASDPERLDTGAVRCCSGCRRIPALPRRFEAAEGVLWSRCFCGLAHSHITGKSDGSQQWNSPKNWAADPVRVMIALMDLTVLTSSRKRLALRYLRAICREIYNRQAGCVMLSHTRIERDRASQIFRRLALAGLR